MSLLKVIFIVVTTMKAKLDLRSLKCVFFLGYPIGTKGYMLWEIRARGIRILVSLDVIFNELVFPCRESISTEIA